MSSSRGDANARAMARRLLERETRGVTEQRALGAAMQRAIDRVSHDLRAAFGTDGFDALLARAINHTEREHPIVGSMRRADGAEIQLDVAGAIGTSGTDAARAGLETVLAALLEILADLIGADMTRNLLHDDDVSREPDDEAQR